MEAGKSKSEVKTNSVAQSDEDIKAADKGKNISILKSQPLLYIDIFLHLKESNNILFLLFASFLRSSFLLLTSVLECLGACFAYSCYCCTYCLMFCAGRDTDEAAD